MYMVFIILQLARAVEGGVRHLRAAARLGVGLVGFAAKGLIKFFLSGIVE